MRGFAPPRRGYVPILLLRPTRPGSTVPDPERSPDWDRAPSLTLEECRAAFERSSAYTMRVEEELMLVFPDSYDLAPMNEKVISSLGGAPGFARELRASQIEIVTPVCANAAQIEHALAASRRLLLGSDIAEREGHPGLVSWLARETADLPPRPRSLEKVETGISSPA